MWSTGPMTSRTLYLFGSAAPPVFDIATVISDAQSRGWDVWLGLTPTAARWLDAQKTELERLTGGRSAPSTSRLVSRTCGLRQTSS